MEARHCRSSIPPFTQLSAHINLHPGRLEDYFVRFLPVIHFSVCGKPSGITLWITGRASHHTTSKSSLILTVYMFFHVWNIFMYSSKYVCSFYTTLSRICKNLRIRTLGVHLSDCLNWAEVSWLLGSQKSSVDGASGRLSSYLGFTYVIKSPYATVVWFIIGLSSPYSNPITLMILTWSPRLSLLSQA